MFLKRIIVWVNAVNTCNTRF